MKKQLALTGLITILAMQFVLSQNVQITGIVTSAEDGMPMPGVSVIIKDTSLGTATDQNGKYKILAPQNAKSLLFSFVGMVTLEVEIMGRSEVNVILQSESVGLDEVIVLGYATRGKNSITGSTVQVKADAIKDIPVVSVDQALQGKVPGLVISTSSGTPGSIQDIRIRGVGSFGVAGASSEPLYVIDGVPMVSGEFSGNPAETDANYSYSSLNALSTLNNDDIESVTVLKDASATSAYGARGSNGVIVITTKKGRKDITKFNLSFFHGFQNKATNGYDVLTGKQREELFLESIYNTYGSQNGFTEDETYQWASTYQPNLLVSLNRWINAGRPEINWEEAVRNKNAPTTNMSFSANGGDKSSSFYTSLNYNKTEAVILGSDFSRISGSLNYNRDFSKRVKFSTSNSVSNTIQNGFLEQSAYFASPILLKYFMSPWNLPYNDDGTVNLNVGNLYNYLYLKDHDISENDLTRAITNSNVEWEIIENLKFKSLVGIDYMLLTFRRYNNRNHGQYTDINGYAATTIRKNFNLVAQNSLSYKYSVNDHNINVMALIEYQKNAYSDLYGDGEGFVADGLTYLSSTGSNWSASSSFNDWYNVSYLGMANYTYQGKYVADATYRREGSSRFSSGHRFGNFWSFGGAWNMKQEVFLTNVDVISMLRLRASMGVSGNSAIDINSYQSLLGYDVDYGGLGAIYPSSYGSPFLTWEKNINYDTGLDFAFFDNRISGSFSYFNKKTFDLLQNVPLSATQGHISLIMNVGEVLNSGIESILEFEFIKTRDFNLNVSLNFATLTNEVLDMAKDGDGQYINIETGTRKIEVGHPIYEWNMRKWAGVNPETGRPQWFINGVDGDVTEIYSDAQRAYQGASAIPTYTGGGSLSLEYKGIFFNTNIYFAGGHKIYEDWAFYTHHSGFYTTAYYQGVSTLMDRWQKPGDITDVPIQVYNGVGNNASSTSTRFLFNGDYIRIKDIVFGYNIPKKFLKHLRFDGASLYVRGTNLFTHMFDERLKYDPEVRADGFTNLTNPPIKSLTVGINLNF